MKKRFGIIVFWLIIEIVLSLLFIKWIDREVSPTVMNYSIGEAKKIISIIINRSINSDLFEKNDMEKLYILNRDENNEILAVTLNSIILNRLTDKISDICEDNLRLVEDYRLDELEKEFNIGKEYFFVPSGLFLGTKIFSNLGPDIPIRIKLIGNVTSGVKTEVKEYGINNSLITISITISVEVSIILPFNSESLSITNDIPVSIKMINGKVPEFYGGYYLK